MSKRQRSLAMKKAWASVKRGGSKARSVTRTATRTARRRYSASGGAGLRKIFSPIPMLAGVMLNWALDTYDPLLVEWADWKEYGKNQAYRRDLHNVITGITLPIINKRLNGQDYLTVGVKNLITDFVKTKLELPQQSNEWKFKTL